MANYLCRNSTHNQLSVERRLLLRYIKRVVPVDSTSCSEEYREESESDRYQSRLEKSTCLYYSNHNSDVQKHNQDQEVPRDTNLFPHRIKWELLPDLVFDPAVHEKFTQQTRIKWSS